jgi:membrane protease YdiL (CAAX protease family)
LFEAARCQTSFSMAPPLDDPWLTLLVRFVLFGSVASWIYIFGRWRRHGVVLPYEPRREAPWGPGAALLAIVLALLAVLAALAPAGIEPAAQEPEGKTIAVRIAAFTISQLVLVGGFFVVIWIVYRATVADLGLPRSSGEALRDVGIGIVTCFAALMPVRTVQGFLLWLMGREDDVSQHPLIETITSGGGVDTMVMLLACLSAVVVAPVCEEVAFRLLFQGWLEKREDEVVRIDPDGGPDEWTIQARNTTLEESTKPLLMRGPAQRGLAGLPYGWMPILVSSLLFGLAHAGYGPEPVPLFLFAIFLGYVFQRTNRILPCIVAHALFNSVTMVALWRIVVQGAE